MELKSPVEIAILTFFKTGRFDYLKLGQTKQWIINNFPDPDRFGLGNSLEEAKIWAYGSIELHFDKDKLFLIFSELQDGIEGGESLQLHKWILSDANALTAQFVIENLIIEQIDFAVMSNFITEQIIVQLKNSQVELRFDSEEGDGNKITNPNLYKLGSFSLMAKIER